MAHTPVLYRPITAALLDGALYPLAIIGAYFMGAGNWTVGGGLGILVTVMTIITAYSYIESTSERASEKRRLDKKKEKSNVGK